MTNKERLEEIEKNVSDAIEWNTHGRIPLSAANAQSFSDYLWLIGRVKELTAALELYAMTNETFPEYGDVARRALEESE